MPRAVKKASSSRKATRPHSTRAKTEKKESKQKVEKKETAPKKATKKSTSSKSSPKKSTPRKHKPSYLRMVQKCLQASGEPYVSSIAIMKYVESNFPVTEGFKRYVKQALKKGVEEGELVKMRGSFRLSAQTARRLKRGSSSTSASPKKTSAKKESTSNKRSRSASPSSSPKKKAKKESTEKTPKATPKKKEKKEGEKKEKKEKKEGEKKEKKEGEKKEKKKEKEKTSSPKKTSRSSKKGTETETSKEKEKESDNDKQGVSLANAKHDYVWQYQENNAWKNYDAEASDLVEEVYQKYQQNKGDTDVRAVKSGQWEYMVDFMAMKQTNIQHEQHTTRAIRRVPRRK